MSEEMVLVVFTRSSSPYQAGELAGFPRDQANRMLNLRHPACRLAVKGKDYDIQKEETTAVEANDTSGSTEQASEAEDSGETKTESSTERKSRKPKKKKELKL